MQHDVHIILRRGHEPLHMLRTGSTLITLDLAFKFVDHGVTVVNQRVQFSAFGHCVLQHGLEVAKLTLFSVQLSPEPLNSRMLVLSVSPHLDHDLVFFRVFGLQKLHLLLQSSTLRRRGLDLCVEPQQLLDLGRQIFIDFVLLLQDLHILLVNF